MIIISIQEGGGEKLHHAISIIKLYLKVVVGQISSDLIQKYNDLVVAVVAVVLLLFEVCMRCVWEKKHGIRSLCVMM